VARSPALVRDPLLQALQAGERCLHMMHTARRAANVAAGLRARQAPDARGLLCRLVCWLLVRSAARRCLLGADCIAADRLWHVRLLLLVVLLQGPAAMRLV
jgi:hypothetical protein